MTETSNYWSTFIASTDLPEPKPSAEDLEYVAEYNASGDKERYGAHFADVEGLAEEVEVQDEQEALVEWLAAQTWSDFAQDLARAFGKFGSLTPKQLEAAKRMKAKVDARQRPERKALEVPGLYFKDDVIYRVRQSANGNWYAQKLDVSPETFEFTRGFSGGNARFEYVGREPLYELTEDDKLTAETAGEWGKRYGICGVCGRTLTDPESIERGVGPICVQGL